MRRYYFNRYDPVQGIIEVQTVQTKFDEHKMFILVETSDGQFLGKLAKDNYHKAWTVYLPQKHNTLNTVKGFKTQRLAIEFMLEITGSNPSRSTKLWALGVSREARRWA